MVASLRVGVASRGRVPGAQTADFARVRQDGAVTLAALANAYDSGFATCWLAGSRLLLDLFFAEWDAGDARSPLAARLLATFAATRQRFTQEAAALTPRDEDFLDASPAATLLAVVHRGHTAHLAWIGGDVAVLARRGEPVEVTTPHTLREQLRRERPELGEELSAAPNILSRIIGADAPDQAPPERATFQMQPGDWLLLVSRAAFTGPCVSPADAACAASMATEGAPAALAEHLAVREIGASSSAPYTAIAALYLPPEER